eukprot:TRINITY_DN6173_c0_g1_i2.p1 TRINITY_DN6173_c0_g1~~TRINITY_DN6173_c0_g1_i2.p1  ORF type:complete len:423 (+),score=55.36 TRINITY_DN6173_c0_g1_i2:185-1453(+)
MVSRLANVAEALAIPRHVQHIVVGLSGGVDSSVSAAILKHLGYKVTGVFMRNWDEREETGHCPADQDAEECASVCDHLDIAFGTVDFVKQYWNNVFSAMLEDYQAGLTPNPDILCNQHIKFDSFHDHVYRSYGCDMVATGHYAQRQAIDDQFALMMGADVNKDQSYFLAGLPSHTLQQSLFPVGSMSKSEVYELADHFGLPSHVTARKESMGICFIGKRRFPDFLSQYFDDRPGEVRDAGSNRIIGSHSGAYKYTLGQNAKLQGMSAKQLIIGKDMHNNVLYTTSDATDSRLFSRQFLISDVRLTRSNIDLTTLALGVRHRHRAPLVAAKVTPVGSTDKPSAIDFAVSGYQPGGGMEGMFEKHIEQCEQASYVITLCNAIRMPVAGQYAAFYTRDGECLGRGRIVSVLYDTHEITVARWLTN